MKNYKEFLDYCRLRAEDMNEWYNEIEIADRIHEIADGSPHVIYYAKAWELVNMMRECNLEKLNDASDEVDLTQAYDLHNLMSAIAYNLISDGIRKAYYELIEPKAVAK